MDTSLVFVTLASLAMAASLSVVVWRLLRDERRRSEARVAALTRLAADPGPAPRPIARPAQLSRVAPLDLPLNPEPARTSRVKPPSSGLDPRSSTLASRPSADIFAPRPASSSWGARLVVMGALALVGATIWLFAATAQVRKSGVARLPARGTVAAENLAPTLELLALHDARDGDSLTISGTVRNPRGAAALHRVTVSALAFDASGAYVASGRALLDVTALAPGDDSPFVVTVPSAASVARYRIAFRAEDGRVIAHTDHRQSGPVTESTSAALTMRGTQ